MECLGIVELHVPDRPIIHRSERHGSLWQDGSIFHSWAAFLSTSSDHEPGNQVGEQQRNPEGQR